MTTNFRAKVLEVAARRASELDGAIAAMPAPTRKADLERMGRLIAERDSWLSVANHFGEGAAPVSDLVALTRAVAAGPIDVNVATMLFNIAVFTPEEETS